MIITGEKIKEEIKLGRIFIEPFNEEYIQPNSYDFHLGENLIVYSNTTINSRNPKGGDAILMNSSGYLLKPRNLYLGITQESTGTDIYSQLLFGNLSTGTLGIWVQISAPLAHVGSKIRWTLEIRVLKETIVYPYMKFGKICFLCNSGKIRLYGSSLFWRSGKYTNDEIAPSSISQDKAP